MTLCAVAGGATFDYGLDNSGNAPTCSSMRRWFTSTGEYELLDDAKHTSMTDYLKRGDILVDEDSHTIMVLENGSQITESSGVKVALAITDIRSTEVHATAKILKIEDGIEKPITDLKDFESYNWTYTVTPLSGSDDLLKQKKFELKAGTAKFSLTSLAPYKTYMLNVIAKDTSGNAVFRSANVLFTTLQSYPTAVRNLNTKFDAVDSLNIKCTVSFNEPNSWGTTGYTNGYRTYLIVNGKIVDYSDTLIKPDSRKVNKTILINDFTENIVFDYNDTIQIGIQPWLKDDNKNMILDNTTLKCSQPVYNKHFLNIIDKMFLKVKDNFKQTLLYKK
jgi:hypothetical protein